MLSATAGVDMVTGREIESPAQQLSRKLLTRADQLQQAVDTLRGSEPFHNSSRRTTMSSPILDMRDFFGLGALLSLGHDEGNLVTFHQGLASAAFTSYCREVDEHVLALVVGADETKPLLVVEPLHYS